MPRGAGRTPAHSPAKVILGVTGAGPKARGSGHQVCSVLRICISRSGAWKGKLRACDVTMRAQGHREAILPYGQESEMLSKESHLWRLNLLSQLSSQL